MNDKSVFLELQDRELFILKCMYEASYGAERVVLQNRIMRLGHVMLDDIDNLKKGLHETQLDKE